MATKNPNVDYAAKLEEIRDIYLHSTPKQRYRIIWDRIDDDAFNGPNRLVTMVSAVEAYLRCLLVHNSSRNEDERRAKYQKVRFAKVGDMLTEVLAHYGITDESTHFQDHTLELLGYAVEYRNMLVHECTYLGGDKFPSMIQACQEVLCELARLSGVSKE